MQLSLTQNKLNLNIYVFFRELSLRYDVQDANKQTNGKNPKLQNHEKKMKLTRSREGGQSQTDTWKQRRNNWGKVEKKFTEHNQVEVNRLVKPNFGAVVKLFFKISWLVLCPLLAANTDPAWNPANWAVCSVSVRRVRHLQRTRCCHSVSPRVSATQ